MSKEQTKIQEKRKPKMNKAEVQELSSSIDTEMECKKEELELLVNLIKADNTKEPDPNDMASTTELSNARLARIDGLQARIEKLRAAKERIEKGTFDGICKKCGDVIPFERLLAQPSTMLCSDCKTIDESIQLIRFGFKSGQHHTRTN